MNQTPEPSTHPDWCGEFVICEDCIRDLEDDGRVKLAQQAREQWTAFLDAAEALGFGPKRVRDLIAQREELRSLLYRVNHWIDDQELWRGGWSDHVLCRDVERGLAREDV